ncbi:MAG: division/cell wall cluster transcriptional repressor MraZ [Propionibacteriaceae bacterium]|jgi:MraZ protein|nr:division/cell wall cluster transcriptional repressor MraZ [Propionibacteriaceae bacterium]
MFRGTATPKLDDKFRLALPAKYRDELTNLVTVTCEIERCLGVYRRDDFDRKMQAYNDAPTTLRAVRDFQRYMQSGAEDVTPDGQGRITLTAAQRDYAGLGKEVVVIGSGDHLEVWDPALWADYRTRLVEQFTDFDGQIVPTTS